MLFDVAAMRDAEELRQSWYKEDRERYVYNAFDDSICDTEGAAFVTINTISTNRILCAELNRLNDELERERNRADAWERQARSMADELARLRKFWSEVAYAERLLSTALAVLPIEH